MIEASAITTLPAAAGPAQAVASARSGAFVGAAA